MVVQQSATQRNRRVASKALYATLGLALCTEIYGLLHQQQLRFLTLEYSLLYATSFILAFTFIWLTAKRNMQIIVSQSGLEISHDEDVVRFAWREVKRMKQPSLLRRYWLFELKNTKRIKVTSQYFSRTQRKQFTQFLTQAINTDSTHAPLMEADFSHPRITHPRVINSNRR
jgi:hypothetical protein